MFVNFIIFNYYKLNIYKNENLFEINVNDLLKFFYVFKN